MIGIENSCDPKKLGKVIIASRNEMRAFYGLAASDKEEILWDVIWKFEVEKGKYPVSVYARYCRNKVISRLTYMTAQKRKNSKVVDGVRVYFDDISLNIKVGDEEDMEYGDFIPTKDRGISELELIASIELKTPELVAAVQRVLGGGTLTRKEKVALRLIFDKEDLI